MDENDIHRTVGLKYELLRRLDRYIRLPKIVIFRCQIFKHTIRHLKLGVTVQIMVETGVNKFSYFFLNCSFCSILDIFSNFEYIFIDTFWKWWLHNLMIYMYTLDIGVCASSLILVSNLCLTVQFSRKNTWVLE